MKKKYFTLDKFVIEFDFLIAETDINMFQHVFSTLLSSTASKQNDKQIYEESIDAMEFN